MSIKRIGILPDSLNAKATSARRHLIGRLRRSQVEAAACVAEVLAGCSAARPCQSGACPVCGAAFQELMVAIGNQFIRIPASKIRNRAHALTIVPSSGCVAPNNLTIGVFKQVGAEIVAALDRLGFPSTLIGLEATFTEDITGQVESHWCVHGHTNGVDWPSDSLVYGLKADFPPSPWVKRPVRLDLLDDRSEGRRYPFKPQRLRRVTQLIADDPARAPYRESKYRPLRPWQAVSLAITEHELGFERRLLIHGIDKKAVGKCFQGPGWPGNSI